MYVATNAAIVTPSAMPMPFQPRSLPNMNIPRPVVSGPTTTLGLLVLEGLTVRDADEADQNGTPILHLAAPRSEKVHVARRYERQLCLSMSGLARLLGPHLARSVAITGSDTYFPTGTDVAVLFEAPKAELLENMVLAQVPGVGGAKKAAKYEEGEIDGIAYHAMRSPDRVISSYVARIGDAA